MAEIERLRGFIEWIDLWFVERSRTPEWAIQVGVQCHLAYMSTEYSSQFLDDLGANRSHVAVHNWVHKADLQHASTVSADQLAVAEKVIRITGSDYWLYGAVDPETNDILQLRLFPATPLTAPRSRGIPMELSRSDVRRPGTRTRSGDRAT
jgi:transposase-like protein